MITFKLDIPKDFAAQISKAFEKQLADHIRKDGIHGVTVKIDRNGQAVFSGPDDQLTKVSKSLEKWR